MKRKKSVVLLLSLSCATTTIGYASWVANYYYNYVQTNKVQDVPVAYIIGKEDVKYTTIEKALEDAQSGDIVCVIPPTKENYNDQTNANNPDSVIYKISRNCVIKSGVTLFIPTDKNSVSQVTDSASLSTYISNMKKSSRDQGNNGYNSYAEKAASRFLRVTIEIENGKTLTNKGTLLISGYLSGGTSNSGCVGQTSHSYSRIVLGEGSRILQDESKAITYCFGFINEKTTNNNSNIMFENGKLYIPCVINDYRGFTYSYAMTNGAIDTERCSPFNLIEFRNIDVKSTIKYNCSVYSLINIYVKYDTLGVDQTMFIEKGVIGTTNDFLLKLSDSQYSSIVYKYNSISNTFNAKCYGGFVFNYLTITLSLKGQSLDLSTKNAYFPISYKFDIELLAAEGQENCTYDITNQRMKVMTGGKVVVGDNVTLNGNEIVVYSSFLDGSYGNGQNVKNHGRETYQIYDNGHFEVLNSAKVNMTSCAGNIYCDNTDNINTTNISIVSKEPWTVGTSGSITVPWTITNYLELAEVLSIVPISFKNKLRICAGVNCFTNSNGFKPKYLLYINNKSLTFTIDSVQQVLFFDDISSYSVELVKNIYTIYYNKTFYTRNTEITYNANNKFICATNSDIQILNDNNGINEFDVQNIEITGSSHTMELETVLQLKGTITDINKSYVKKYKWSSVDSTIATVDQTGLVTAVGVGTTTIQLTCDNVIGTFDINVIQPISDIEVVDFITISEKGGKKSGDTFKDGAYTFNCSITGVNGSSLTIDDIGIIEWSFRNQSSDPGNRIYFGTDSNNKVITASATLSVVVTIKGGANANTDLNASEDIFYVVCKVTDKKGNVISSEFKVVNDNGTGCLSENSLVLAADGTYKKAIDIRTNDMLMTVNHETGKFEPAPVVFNDDFDKLAEDYNVIILDFSNGKSIEIVYEHGFFDLNTMKYEYITEVNYKSFIGHRFISIDIVGVELVRSESILINAFISKKHLRICSPVTYKNLNIITEGMLSMPGGIEGIFNIFDYNDDLSFNSKKKENDIKKYGLFDYSYFKDKIPYKFYEAFNGKYLKVALGKGILTEDMIDYYINRYLPVVKKQNN